MDQCTDCYFGQPTSTAGVVRCRRTGGYPGGVCDQFRAYRPYGRLSTPLPTSPSSASSPAAPSCDDGSDGPAET